MIRPSAGAGERENDCECRHAPQTFSALKAFSLEAHIASPFICLPLPLVLFLAPSNLGVCSSCDEVGMSVTC